MVLGVFLVGLAVACGVAVRSAASDPPSVPPMRASAAGATSTDAVAPRSTTFDAAVGDITGCQSLAGAEPQLLCPFPDGVVEYTQVADAATAYRRVAGADDAIAARGEAACATGRSEERAWARPDAPATEVGRYLCRVVGDRAEIWWTVDDAGLLGHAFRRDDDLAALFSWWRSGTEGEPEHP
jgi:hypothetical protein